MTPQNFWIWFGGIWCSVGSLFLVIGLSVGLYHVRLHDRLDKDGRNDDGIVLTKEIRFSTENGSRSGPSYHVTFRFAPVDGTLVRGEAEVGENAWDALTERGPIQVTFLPDAPQSHRVAGQTSSPMILSIVFSVLGGILACFGGFVLFTALGTRRQHAALRRTGMVAEATVTDIDPSAIRINRVQQWTLRYRFQDVHGTAQTGSCTVSPEEAEQWQVGHTGSVRYDPTRPRAHVWVGKAL